MDIKLGLSIYNKPWLVEPNAAMQMLEFWEEVKAGAKWSYGKAVGRDERVNAYSTRNKFFASNGIVLAPQNSWDMEEFEGFGDAKVAVIPVTGPIMKHDFCGDLGTSSLKALTRMASETKSVQSIVYLVDTPGGTVDGTEGFAAEIKASPKNTIAFVEGQMCSAGYWIGSACDKIYAGNKTDFIGCIGTMITLRDNSKALEKNGVVLREYYATDSGDKNKDITDAKKGNGKALIESTLDPLNDVFLANVKAGRPGVSAEALSGKTYMAETAQSLGLIDGIKSIDDVMNEACAPKKKKMAAAPTNNIQLLKNSKMTAAEFKQNHPEAYNEVFSAGIKAEKTRVKSWLAFMDADQKASIEGIKGDAEVDGAVLAEMSVKIAQKGAAQKAEAGNPAKITTPVNNTPVQSEADAAAAATKADFLKLCGISE